jgi:DNA-binding CsgD family transcriptional regulator/PAS domain-containing protein
MTFQSRSVVEFGRFLAEVSEGLMAGAPLRRTAELILAHFTADVVAIQIEDRFSAGAALTVATRDAAGPAPATAADLARLAALRPGATASASSACGHTRYSLTVLRARDAAALDEEEATLCELLVEQIRRGLEISTRLGEGEVERALYSGMMDRLFVGLVILDAQGNILKTSPAADRLLAARDGLQRQGGRLHACLGHEDRELQANLREALAGGGRGRVRALALSKPSGARDLGIIIKPVAAPAGGNSSAAVAVILRDPSAQAEIEGSLVKQLFDLTPAETAVANRLTAGQSLEEAAAALNISRNTARAHLRSIFSKSGITRQTDLVRLMLNSAAVLGDPAPAVAG